MMQPTILVSGRSGQLGSELEKLSGNYPGYRFIFFDRNALDITNATGVEAIFNEYQPAFFINTAAYTAVDKAESDQEAAYKTNAEAVGMIASACERRNATFISFSTDYVFNGEGTAPYREDSPIAPVNYYGYTKAMGEQLALANCSRTIIIRTSWVYSAHGHNFVKTMLRLMKERAEINVVNDQFGAPTCARDLAEVTLHIVEKISAGTVADPYGIFHYSNEGKISWFDFASEIKKIAGLSCNVHPIPTSGFPTPAKRPHYSVLDNRRLVSTFGMQLKDWKTSLKACLAELT